MLFAVDMSAAEYIQSMCCLLIYCVLAPRAMRLREVYATHADRSAETARQIAEIDVNRTTIIEEFNSQDLSHVSRLIVLKESRKELLDSNAVACRQAKNIMKKMRAMQSDALLLIENNRRQADAEWKNIIRQQWNQEAITRVVMTHASAIEAEETPTGIPQLFGYEYRSHKEYKDQVHVILQPYHADKDVFPAHAKFVDDLIDLYPDDGRQMRELMETKSFTDPAFASVPRDTGAAPGDVSKPQFAHAVLKTSKFKFAYFVGPKAVVDNHISTAGDLIVYEDLDACDEDSIRAAVRARFSEMKLQRGFDREVQLLASGFIYKPNQFVSLEEMLAIYRLK